MNTDPRQQRQLIQRHRDAIANGADRARLAYLEVNARLESVARRGDGKLSPYAQQQMAAWDSRTREFCQRVCENDWDG